MVVNRFFSYCVQRVIAIIEEKFLDLSTIEMIIWAYEE
jgi:hypothetical protein